jgi:hypothetical protein
MDPVEAEIERRELTAYALAMIAERHGLDDYDARRHLLVHAVNYPRMVQ